MQERYVTISALTKYLKKKMEIDPHLQEIYVKGEISNFNSHRSGHMYLTIKDNTSRIQAVMFRRDNQSLKFRPENGMNVLLKGHVTVFESYGQYQLYIKEMQPAGIGALYLAYEQLKEDLQKRGLFDAAHKKPLPKYPSSIALITSPTGAAVRDMITTIKRRYPIAQISVIPTLVQGSEATEAIAKSIELANEIDDFDTIIVGRGGGSIEDLWAFNELKVVEAIYHSHIPIISAVGHETDTTLSDFVADLRAPTPTGAAELAVPSLIDLNENMLHMKTRLQQLLQIQISYKREQLQNFKKSAVFHAPKQIILEKQQLIDRLTDKMHVHMQTKLRETENNLLHVHTKLNFYHPKQKLHHAKDKLTMLTTHLTEQTNKHLHSHGQQFARMVEKLTLVNPLHILRRGYALPYREDGTMVKTVEDVNENDHITVQLNDGALNCQINDIRRDHHDK